MAIQEFGWFIVGIMFLMYAVNMVLSFLTLQHRHQPLAKNVVGIFKKDAYQKSKQYAAENALYAMVTNTFSFFLYLALFVSRFFPWLITFVSGLTPTPVLQTFLFFTLLLITNTIIKAPFNYYRTFSIETRYGFNRSTKKLFFTDLLRNLLVSTILVSLIGLILHALYLGLGNFFILGAWITLSVLLMVLFALNTKVFIKIFNKLTPLKEGSLKNAITSLAIKTGFKAKAIYTMDASKRSSKLNAFFSGFGPIREIGLFDTLIQKLTEEEVLAVLAHEIGHAKHFDEIRMLVQQILVFGMYALAISFVVMNPLLASGLGLTSPFFGFGLILFSILIEPLDFILGIPLSYLSRKAEYAADAFAVSQGYRQEMITALKKLVTENYANLTPHPLQVLLTYSHPPMSLRLAALEQKKR
jgi:STE24 endopeptidase